MIWRLVLLGIVLTAFGLIEDIQGQDTPSSIDPVTILNSEIVTKQPVETSAQPPHSYGDQQNLQATTNTNPEAKSSTDTNSDGQELKPTALLDSSTTTSPSATNGDSNTTDTMDQELASEKPNFPISSDQFPIPQESSTNEMDTTETSIDEQQPVQNLTAVGASDDITVDQNQMAESTQQVETVDEEEEEYEEAEQSVTSFSETDDQNGNQSLVTTESAADVYDQLDDNAVDDDLDGTAASPESQGNFEDGDDETYQLEGGENSLFGDSADQDDEAKHSAQASTTETEKGSFSFAPMLLIAAGCTLFGALLIYAGFYLKGANSRKGYRQL